RFGWRRRLALGRKTMRLAETGEGIRLLARQPFGASPPAALDGGDFGAQLVVFEEELPDALGFGLGPVCRARGGANGGLRRRVLDLLGVGALELGALLPLVVLGL